MAGPVDRSIGLADLAARAQAGPQERARSRSNCRNPECVNGMTPGLVASGGGSKGKPLFGPDGVGAKRLMRWAWTNCLACNAPEGARRAGAVYRHLNLSEGEIARRAQMANTKASYQPEIRETLRRPGSAPHAADNKQLTELLEQNKQLNERIAEMLKQNAEMTKQNTEMTQTLSRMSMQIAALLEDNAKLREENKSTHRDYPPPTPPPNDMGT